MHRDVSRYFFCITRKSPQPNTPAPLPKQKSSEPFPSVKRIHCFLYPFSPFFLFLPPYFNKTKHCYDTLHFCDRRRGFLLRQRHYLGQHRQVVAGTRLYHHHTEIRPLHQHRPRDAEPLRAWRVLCDRGRHGDRPRSRPL